MERILARDIFESIKEYGEQNNEEYKVRILPKQEYINKFHYYVDGKDIVGIINVYSKDKSYYFVFLDWWNNGEYYMIIYPDNKSKNIMDMHKVEELYNSSILKWRYKPMKRDGKNDDRKNCFKKYYGDLEISIKIPRKTEEVDEFLYNMFDLIDKRIKSDNMD